MKPYCLFAASIAMLATGCTRSVIDESRDSGNGDDGPGVGETDFRAPSVLSTTPLDGATGAPTNGNASITFDDPMDCASLTEETFTLTSDADGTRVPGTVICVDRTAMFWPKSQLPGHRTWTATVTTGAKSEVGGELASEHVWGFTTGQRFNAGIAVRLGTAVGYAVFAEGGIASTPGSEISGNVGVSPATSASISGFTLMPNESHSAAKSPGIFGQVFAADFDGTTPSMLADLIVDSRFGFDDAAARAPDLADPNNGVLNGTQLEPGVYRWDDDLRIANDVSLVGDLNDVWIFQIGRDLALDADAHIKLVGGALSKHVVWQVQGHVDVGAAAHVEGVIFAQRDVSLEKGSSVSGRVLTRATVRLDDAVVAAPHAPAWSAD